MGKIAFRTEIKFKDGLTADEYKELKKITQDAHNNRIGTAKDISVNMNECVFEGSEDTGVFFGACQVELTHREGFLDYVKSWDFYDLDYPEENYSVIEGAIQRGIYCPENKNEMPT